MRPSVRISTTGASILVAIAAVAITAAAVLAAGILILPGEGPDPWQESGTLPTIEDVVSAQALLVLTGDDEGRYELNQLSVGEWNEETAPDDPLRLSLTFRGDGASLVISAAGIRPGAPATGDAASATLSVPGASYFGNNGECSISLEELDHIVLEPQGAVLDGVPRGVPIPTYAGIVTCTGIEELRSDRRIDMTAVFRHRPQE